MLTKKAWLISASILGMVATGSAGVYAGSKLPEIKAILNTDLGIVVNNADFKPVDGNGKKISPITYNNTTYLPVRAVSDALNVPVKYDKASNKVVIGNSSSSSSNGGATTPPSSSFVRPKYLPSDFPLPKDTKQIELIENAGNDGKNVIYTLQTKESLKQLTETYRTYFNNRGYNSPIDSSTDSKIDYINNSDKENVMITSKIINASTGLAEIEIIWNQSK